MSRRWNAIAGLLVVSAMLRSGSAIAAAEEIIYDEMDFYDHARFAGNVYPPFAVERVRRVGAEYFLRYSSKTATATPFGKRFGELVLLKERGSILYLPQALSSTSATAVTFWFKKAQPKAKLFFSLYRGAKDVATVVEGSPLLQTKGEVDWQKVSIPLAKLKYEKLAPHPKKPNYDDLNDPLRYYPPSAGKIYGIEIGLTDAAPGDVLQFDRISLEHKAKPTNDVRGTVSPVVAGLAITIGTPAKDYSTVTDGKGRFSFTLPPDVTRYQLSTKHDGIWYYPTAGTYFERGSFIPPVEFELTNVPTKYVVSTDAYTPEIYDSEKGNHYPPHALHLYSERRQSVPDEFFTENHSNNIGYLDRDRRTENIDGVDRVVLVGECYPLGQQVNSVDKFNHRAEARLRFMDAPPTEIFNVSHGTLTLTSAWPALKSYVFGLKPKLILINFPTSSLLKLLSLEYDARSRAFDPAHPFVHHFELDAAGNLVEKPVDPEWVGYRLDAPPWTEEFAKEWEWPFLGDPKLPVPENAKRNLEILTKSLALIVKEAKKHDARVGIAYTSTEGLDGYARAADLVREAAAMAGAEFFMLNQSLSRSARDRSGKLIGHWPVGGHWSPAGHAAIGQELSEFVLGGLKSAPGK